MSSYRTYSLYLQICYTLKLLSIISDSSHLYWDERVKREFILVIKKPMATIDCTILRKRFWKWSDVIKAVYGKGRVEGTWFLKSILVFMIFNTKATIEIYNLPLNISKIYFMKIEHNILKNNITGRLRFIYVILERFRFE